MTAVSGKVGLLGSPAQPHGQVLKTALTPPRSPRRQQPPSLLFHLIPLYSPAPITDKWQRPDGRSRDSASRSPPAERPPASGKA